MIGSLTVCAVKRWGTTAETEIFADMFLDRNAPTALLSPSRKASDTGFALAKTLTREFYRF